MTSLNPHTVQRLAAAAIVASTMPQLRQPCWSVDSKEAKGFYALSASFGLDTIVGTQLPEGPTR